MATRRWKGVTIEHVATRAGVSITTVSRVVTGSTHKVNPHTREAVLKAVRELNYHPNAVARSLIHGSTATLGVLIPDLSNPYYVAIVNGVEAAALAAGYAVLLCNTDRNLNKRQYYVRILQEKRIEGLIVAGSSVPNEDLGIFDQIGIPLAGVASAVTPDIFVEVDNFAATFQLTKHLVRLGHRHLAFLAGPSASLSSNARINGCRAALAEHGGSLADHLVLHGDWRSRSGYELTLHLLETLRGSSVTAIVAANDLMALGALRALRNQGIEVPKEVSVAGHDDISEASFTYPTLTTMRIPAYELGRCATEMLIQLIEKGGSATRMAFEAELVQRESTGPPPS